MSESGEISKAGPVPVEQPPLSPARHRRAAAQRVREARDRLTSTSGTRPAFDHELLRQYAQTRLSASFVVMLLVVATGLLSGFWVRPIGAAMWTCGILAIHAIIIRTCRKFLGESASPAVTRKWRMRFIALDLLYGVAWTIILVHPSGLDVVSNTLMLFVMLLVVAVSSMLAASLPIAALAATVPVTSAIALNFVMRGTLDDYILAILAVTAEGYFALLAHRLHSTTLATLEARAEKDALIGELEQAKSFAICGQDFVMSCVGNDDDLREVTIGANGAFAGMKAGAVFVDHTTASAAVARELDAESSKYGFKFIDAPVSGGQAGAENGVLTVMCGGDEAAYKRAEPVIAAYARMCKLLGPAGAGQLTKMVNQICIAGLVEGLSEGLHFAKKAGLDVNAVVETISKGAAQSWQMENRYKTMNDGKYDFGFAVDWMRKDLSICLAEARRNGASLPVTALVDNFYAEVQKMGGSRWDTSSLMARLQR